MILELIPWLSFLSTHSLGDFMQSGDFKCYLYACDSLMDIPRKPLSWAQPINPTAYLTLLHGYLTYLKSTALDSHIFLNPLLIFSSLPCPKSVLSTVSPPLSIMPVHLNSCSGQNSWRPPCFLSVAYSTSNPVSFCFENISQIWPLLTSFAAAPKLEPPSFLAQIGQQSTNWTPYCLHGSLHVKAKVLIITFKAQQNPATVYYLPNVTCSAFLEYTQEASPVWTLCEVFPVLKLSFLLMFNFLTALKSLLSEACLNWST